eukprot:4821965-Prymnesium_polylepis.2
MPLVKLCHAGEGILGLHLGVIPVGHHSVDIDAATPVLEHDADAVEQRRRRHWRPSRPCQQLRAEAAAHCDMPRVKDKARPHDPHKRNAIRVVAREDHLQRDERILAVPPSPPVNVLLELIVHHRLWHVNRPAKEVGLVRLNNELGVLHACQLFRKVHDAGARRQLGSGNRSSIGTALGHFAKKQNLTSEKTMAMYDEDAMTGLATALVVLRKLDGNLTTLQDDSSSDKDPYKMLTEKEFSACGGIPNADLNQLYDLRRQLKRGKRFLAGLIVGGKPPTKGEIKACKQLLDKMDTSWADTDDDDLDDLDVKDDVDDAAADEADDDEADEAEADEDDDEPEPDEEEEDHDDDDDDEDDD